MNYSLSNFVNKLFKSANSLLDKFDSKNCLDIYFTNSFFRSDSLTFFISKICIPYNIASRIQFNQDFG